MWVHAFYSGNINTCIYWYFEHFPFDLTQWTFSFWSHTVNIFLLISPSEHFPFDLAQWTFSFWSHPVNIYLLISPSEHFLFDLTQWTFSFWSRPVILSASTDWLWYWKILVWGQTHYDVTDENNNSCFEGLDVHYH